MSVDKLAHALLESGLVDASTVELRATRSRSGRIFLEALVQDAAVTEPSLVNQLARSLAVPRYDPKERHPEPEALAALAPRDAEELGVIPVAVRGGGTLLWAALCDPTDENLLAEIARRSGRRVKPCIVGPRELTRALQELRSGAGATPMPAAYAAPAPPAMPVYAPVPQPPPAAPYGYGYPAPTPMPPLAKSPEIQRLEEELAQAKQVVKVLVQLLVDSRVLDGEELKRRLRAERDRK